MIKSVYSERQKRLSQLLRAARKKAGLRQVDLAKRLGTHSSYVSKYESGERQLDFIEFIEIAEALKLDPAEVLAKIKA